MRGWLRNLDGLTAEALGRLRGMSRGRGREDDGGPSRRRWPARRREWRAGLRGSAQMRL